MLDDGAAALLENLGGMQPTTTLRYGTVTAVSGSRVTVSIGSGGAAAQTVVLPTLESVYVNNRVAWLQSSDGGGIVLGAVKELVQSTSAYSAVGGASLNGGQWHSGNVVEIYNAPAGRYAAVGTITIAANNCYMALRTPAEGVGAYSVQVSAGLNTGILVTGTHLRVFTHPGGTFTVYCDYGYSAAAMRVDYCTLLAWKLP
jgi:hypothetical protein